MQSYLIYKTHTENLHFGFKQDHTNLPYCQHLPRAMHQHTKADSSACEPSPQYQLRKFKSLQNPALIQDLFCICLYLAFFSPHKQFHIQGNYEYFFFFKTLLNYAVRTHLHTSVSFLDSRGIIHEPQVSALPLPSPQLPRNKTACIIHSCHYGTPNRLFARLFLTGEK